MTPTTIEAPPALYTQVVSLAFALAFIFGAVGQRTHFCTMGAIADWVNYGDRTRVHQWLLAIGVAIVGTQTLAALGLIDTAKTIHATPRLTWLAYVLGGALFGFGMVLAGGCGSRNLVRLGTGSLKSLVVFIVLGLVAYMSLRGMLGVFRVNLIEPFVLQLSSAQDLPTLLAAPLGVSKEVLHWALGLGLGTALIAYTLTRRDFLKFDNLLAGFAIGGVIVALWFVSGHVGYLAEHPETLDEAFLRTNSGRMESLSFVAPLAYTLDWLLFFSDKSRVITLGIAAVFGVVLGSLVTALLSKEFRWEGFASTEDTANNLIGAALMGFGGVLALGCTIGQGLSGISTLSLSSLLALVGIVGGAVLALRYQTWRVERMV